jgi:hypothetical protein
VLNVWVKGENADMEQMKTYSLWMEGYITQGNSSKADFLGTFEANSFENACDKWADTIKEKEYYERNGNIASYWGCRIYDNEADARKSFG